MSVDVHVSEIQYWHHLRPIVEALGDRLGVITTSEQLASIVPHAKVGYPEPGDSLTLVASFQDSRAVRTRGHRAIYVEHGAGQTYVTDPHPSYSGGPEHEGTALFLCPREDVAQRWRTSYPGIPAVVVGSPRMDELVKLKDTPEWRSKSNTVAISFHADTKLCYETSSSWPEYNYQLKGQIDQLHDAGIRVIGHAHPRLFRHIASYLESTGAELVQDIEDVYKRACVYAVDNSSTLYEATGLGIPTLTVNASWYRRDVNHGLRFWDKIPGRSCNSPEELAVLFRWALLDTDDPWATRRQEISDYVWGPLDGKSADRAVAAIDSLYHGHDPATDTASE